jgi:hypothetical protein
MQDEYRLALDRMLGPKNSDAYLTTPHTTGLATPIAGSEPKNYNEGRGTNNSNCGAACNAEGMRDFAKSGKTNGALMYRFGRSYYHGPSPAAAAFNAKPASNLNLSLLPSSRGRDEEGRRRHASSFKTDGRKDPDLQERPSKPSRLVERQDFDLNQSTSQQDSRPKSRRWSFSFFF